MSNRLQHEGNKVEYHELLKAGSQEIPLSPCPPSKYIDTAHSSANQSATLAN